MSPPEKMTPLPTPSVPPARKLSPSRALSLAEKCTLAIATATWLKLGCAGVQPRPDPGLCPEENILGMESLGWLLGQGAKGLIVDVNQPPSSEYDRTAGTFKDGPITGSLYDQSGDAPAGTKLEGHLWTSGDLIHGRYLWAHVPGRGRIPVCLELGEAGYPGLPKREGSMPGAALGQKLWTVLPVYRWR